MFDLHLDWDGEPILARIPQQWVRQLFATAIAQPEAFSQSVEWPPELLKSMANGMTRLVTRVISRTLITAGLPRLEWLRVSSGQSNPDETSAPNPAGAKLNLRIPLFAATAETSAYPVPPTPIEISAGEDFIVRLAQRLRAAGWAGAKPGSNGLESARLEASINGDWLKLPSDDALPKLPLDGHLVTGTLRLTVAELRSLRTGDVLLPMAFDSLDSRRAFLRMSARHGVWVRRHEAGSVELDDVTIVDLCEAAESTGTEVLAGTASFGQRADATSIEMHFETARAALTTHDAAALRVGTVVDVAALPEGRTRIFAGGGLFAYGASIAIGDRSGIQLLELSGSDPFMRNLTQDPVHTQRIH